ncbi:16S rRNA (cytidine(1402)-2'-O)-methyltransferase [Chitinispirillales bacterium ANBcel5]|uniref:16S rRNA (cytidine(1402)-2'-O)-methyltransferase n=1 Tax=Cellulosispirillum alkaliphilum TaxID=3039283 RepID=UPI002A5576E6|nr:16S rRNA (cytidine(1402)-2'-O)-methyltransferase [Chitinispirillales bacterium ANBcel5]
MSLYIVSTPIGNLSDITYRAVTVLKESELVLAEDSRITKKLFHNFGISTQIKAYHDFNKEKVTPSLIEQLKENTTMALVTDAGTPGIADPGFYLIRAAIAENITVTPIPGPSAFISALISSGLPTDRFIFENFLPPKSSRRKKLFEQFSTEPRTLIFYESPHRIFKTLRDIDEVLGDVRVVVARELTKIHEEFLRGAPQSLLKHFEKHPPKGEMVVLFNTRIRENG